MTTGYHHGSLRDEMIQIGLELAAEGGPDAVGIREITRRAGVSPAAAYRHFRDQQELRDKVAHEIDGMLNQRLFDAVRSTEGSARDRLMAAGTAYSAFAFENPNLFSYLNSGFEPSQTDSVFLRFVDIVHAMGVEELGHEPDRQHSQNLAIALWSAGHGFCMLATTGALRNLDEATKLELRDLAFTNAVNGLEFR